jgi:hypothetical protein
MLPELLGAASLGARTALVVVLAGSVVTCCERRSTTFGVWVRGLGVVLVGVLVWVVVVDGPPTGVGVVAVPVDVVVVDVVVVCVGAADPVVVGVPAGGVTAGVSAAKAPPVSGPPIPAAVNPPPARAARITRRVRPRASLMRAAPHTYGFRAL